MSKSKREISKAVAGIIMIVGTQAVASGHYVKTSTLERVLDRGTINELVNREVLLPTSISDRFQFNRDQVITILNQSEDPETAEFMKWLLNEVQKESKAGLKKIGDMQLSTQDRVPNK